MDNLKLLFLKNKYSSNYCYTQAYNVKFNIIKYMWKNIFEGIAIYLIVPNTGGVMEPRLFLKHKKSTTPEFEW